MIFKDHPPNADALWYALRIHRTVEPMKWPAMLKQVPSEHAQAVEQYLRDTAHRMRVAIAAKKAQEK